MAVYKIGCNFNNEAVKSARLAKRKEVHMYLARKRDKELQDELQAELDQLAKINKYMNEKPQENDEEYPEESDEKNNAKNYEEEINVTEKPVKTIQRPKMHVVWRSQQLRSGLEAGVEWPPRSPSAGVYDVSYSSARLIRLNRRSSEMRLRGYDNYPRPQTMNTARHFTTDEQVTDYHSQCTTSLPTLYKPSTSLRYMWVNAEARPAVVPDSKLHERCRRPYTQDYEVLDNRRPVRAVGVNAYIKKDSINTKRYPGLAQPGITGGNQRCMYFLSRLYDVANSKQLEQSAYISILKKIQRLDPKNADQHAKYMDYLRSARKKPFGDNEPILYNEKPRAVAIKVRDKAFEAPSPRDTDAQSTSRNVTLGPLPWRIRQKIINAKRRRNQPATRVVHQPKVEHCNTQDHDVVSSDDDAPSGQLLQDALVDEPQEYKSHLGNSRNNSGTGSRTSPIDNRNVKENNEAKPVDQQLPQEQQVADNQEHDSYKDHNTNGDSNSPNDAEPVTFESQQHKPSVAENETHTSDTNEEDMETTKQAYQAVGVTYNSDMANQSVTNFSRKSFLASLVSEDTRSYDATSDVRFQDSIEAQSQHRSSTGFESTRQVMFDSESKTSQDCDTYGEVIDNTPLQRL